MTRGPARRLRMTLAYDGTEYHGWQIQPGLATIEATVTAVLSRIEEAPVRIFGSGRTDAGVHAMAQVASFDLTNPIPVTNLRKAMNRLLPPSIRILDIAEMPEGFHARLDAIAKTYEYRIYRDESCPPFEHRYVYHHPYPLDHQAMHRMAQVFLGSHDMTVFAAADERYANGYNMVRTIFSSVLTEQPDRLIYRVRGTGFLKHMVRNLVGTLIEAGRGNIPADQWPVQCGNTVPARGLFLVSVDYPEAA
ncbi:MAG: tRNA pseudouridine(38-40) synthase TruA [Acidobacteria bacterium]|nr:tRNA pseudouridine(38-40) synthase TruA [Acidobacteriota bacterium]